MSSVSDPIADMLTRIRNAFKVPQLRVDIPSSRMKIQIARILKNEGFIKNFKILDDKRQKVLRIYLKYSTDKQSAIYSIDRISKPGRRVYQNAKDIKPILNNIGISIISTSKGVMTNKAAMKMNIGGEVICKIS
jgi:small subunit ribosomal protein S8